MQQLHLEYLDLQNQEQPSFLLGYLDIILYFMSSLKIPPPGSVQGLFRAAQVFSYSLNNRKEERQSEKE